MDICNKKTESTKVSHVASNWNKVQDSGNPPQLKSKQTSDTSIATPKKLTHPQATPKVTTSRTLTKEFKMIQVSNSGNVTDENDPRCIRTLDHFRQHGFGAKPTAPTSGGLVIKPIVYKPSTTSTRTLSAPINVKSSGLSDSKGHVRKSTDQSNLISTATQSSSTPVSTQGETTPIVETSTNECSKVTTQLVIPVSTEAGSVSKMVSNEKQDSETQKASTNNQMSAVKSTHRGVKQPGGVWYSPKSSLSSSTSKIPTVRTWNRNTDVKTNMRRSQSFTSKITIDVTTKKRHRSSLTLDIDTSDANRPMSATGLNDDRKKLVLTEIKPIMILANTKSNISTSPSITTEVNRIVSVFGTTSGAQGSKHLTTPTTIKTPPIERKTPTAETVKLSPSTTLKTPPPTSPKPHHSKNQWAGAQGSVQYRSLPSRIKSTGNVTGQSPTKTSPDTVKRNSPPHLKDKSSSANNSPSTERKEDGLFSKRQSNSQSTAKQRSNSSSGSSRGDSPSIRRKDNRPLVIERDRISSVGSYILNESKSTTRDSSKSSLPVMKRFEKATAGSRDDMKYSSPTRERRNISATSSLFTKKSSPPLSVKSRIAIFQQESSTNKSSSLPRYKATTTTDKVPSSHLNKKSSTSPEKVSTSLPVKKVSKSVPAVPPKPIKSKTTTTGSRNDDATSNNDSTTGEDIKTNDEVAISNEVITTSNEPVANSNEVNCDVSGKVSDEESDDESNYTNTPRLRITSGSVSEEDATIGIKLYERNSLEQCFPAIEITNTTTVDVTPFDDDPIPDTSIYSYNIYSNMKKQRRNTISSSHSTNEALNLKSLESIPECSVTHVSTSSLPISSKLDDIFCDDTVSNKQDGGELDGESEEGALTMNVSDAFCKEMLDSLATKFNETTGSDNEKRKLKKRLSEVFAQFSMELEDEQLYETLEEYGRKMSDYLDQASENEVPPELPPRPDFLLKLLQIKEESEESAVNEDHSVNILNSYNGIESESVEILSDDYSTYENVTHSDSSAPASPKKKISLFKKTNNKSSSTSSYQKRPKRWKFGRTSKVEPSHSVTLPSQRSSSISECPSEIGVSYNRADSEPPHNYMTVGRRNTCTAAMLSVSSYDNDSIEPTYSSAESEPEEEEDRCSKSLNLPRSVSPQILRRRGGDNPADQMYAGTPDSSVFSEANDSYRHGNYLMTPPVTTKLTLRSTPSTERKGLRISNSDPSLHSKTLHIKGRSMVISPSPSLHRDQLSLDSIISDNESSLTHSVSSFESNKGAVPTIEIRRSPPTRKRVYSDASHDRFNSNSSQGAIQKAQYMLAQKKSGSIGYEAEGVIEVPLVYADALMDCTGIEPDHLSFKVNDVISVLDMRDDDWWQGIVEDRIGWFSASWVRLRIDQDDSSSVDLDNDSVLKSTSTTSSSLPEATVSEEKSEELVEKDEVAELESVTQNIARVRKASTVSRRRTIRKRDSGDLPRHLTPSEIRARCIEEILNTERVYVKHLEDIVEGFLYPCQERNQLFTPEQVDTIFSNVEDIYKFQTEFLKELEARVDTNNLQDSLVGELFVLMKDKFSMYSEYCNNHPYAVNELNLLQHDQQYVLFFEACRLLRNMTEISIEGFLLNPVQRICRYPLQLSELLKHTPETHADYPHVLAAREAMTEVAILINERKRRMESLVRVKLWQTGIENWKGADLIEKSTNLICSGELHKISKGHSQERHFFLFDNQLVYCKKVQELMGGKLSYKGRIDMNKCEIIDLKDGEAPNGIKYAWKINNADKGDKWYVLFAKTAQTKQEWMDAFRMEREQVQEDENNEFKITPKMKRAAAALCNSSSERKPGTRKNHDWASDTLSKPDTSSLGRITNSPNERKKTLKSKKK